MKSALGHRVEPRCMIRQIRLPAAGIPQLQVISDANQRHFVLQAGKLDQPVRNQKASGTIQVNLVGPAEKESPVVPSFCAGRGGHGQACRQIALALQA